MKKLTVALCLVVVVAVPVVVHHYNKQTPSFRILGSNPTTLVCRDLDTHKVVLTARTEGDYGIAQDGSNDYVFYDRDKKQAFRVGNADCMFSKDIVSPA